MGNFIPTQRPQTQAFGGKKILLVLAAVGLLAAGCSGSATTSMTNNGSAPSEPAPAVQDSTAPAVAQQPTAAVQTQVNSQVNSPNDAVNLLVSQSSNEQSSVAGSNDSDLTSSDSADLNSFTGVSDGY